MLITDDFIFAHIPKTGGEFMQSVIRQHWTPLKVIDGDASHHSLEDLPAAHREKPVFTLLRNPWAWYVSWFSFCARQGNNQEFLRNATGNPPQFVGTVSALLKPNHTDPIITEFMARERIGLLEMHRFHILDLEDDGHDIHYGRLEHLEQDFPAFLSENHIAIPEGLGNSLAGDPVNRSDHAPWRSLYTAELQERVAEMERHVIRIGNYRFAE